MFTETLGGWESQLVAAQPGIVIKILPQNWFSEEVIANHSQVLEVIAC